MNLGLIARADRRGLAHLTHNIYEHLHPAKTAVIDMAGHRPFRTTPDIYPDASVVDYDDCLRGRDWSGWLEGLDVMLTCETPYDFGLFTQAAQRGVKTVLLAMPEYLPYAADPTLPRPDVIALPTDWLADRYPGSPILPVPAWPFSTEPGDWWLHPAGGPAKGDRNGTDDVLMAALGDRHSPWLIRAQQLRHRPPSKVRAEVKDFDTREELFAGAALVVMPRRYAGLNLALQDAMSAGLPVIATDCSPYGPVLHPEWGRLPIHSETTLTTYKGVEVPYYHVHPRDLIRSVRAASEHLDELAAWSKAWTEANSWDVLKPRWLEVLA